MRSSRSRDSFTHDVRSVVPTREPLTRSPSQRSLLRNTSTYVRAARTPSYMCLVRNRYLNYSPKWMEVQRFPCARAHFSGSSQRNVSMIDPDEVQLNDYTTLGRACGRLYWNPSASQSCPFPEFIQTKSHSVQLCCSQLLAVTLPVRVVKCSFRQALLS